MQFRVVLPAVALLLAVTPAEALYSVTARGAWPESWPAEMEPLRKQSRTYVGPTVLNQHHAISFQSREEFEAAWPMIVGLKTKGAPIILRRGESFWLGGGTAGVCIHTPPKDQPVVNEVSSDEIDRIYASGAIYIELIIDGDVVDLNRIELPADTPIVDRRFDGTPAGRP